MAVQTDRGKCGNQHMVNLYVNGERKQTTVLRLVALAFYPDKMIDGAMAVHRNGLHSDNTARNVLILTRRQTGGRHAGNRRRAVCKVDRAGQVVEIFASVTAAAAATGMCRTTIRRHCNRDKTVWARPDGYSYRWCEGVT